MWSWSIGVLPPESPLRIVFPSASGRDRNKMSVSPRDLLREARNAAERENEETARRQAISTAYYAAYHAAREYHNNLPRPGRSKQGVGEHENLIHQLRNPDSTLSEEIRNHSTKVGDLLLRLRPSRIRAHFIV